MGDDGVAILVAENLKSELMKKGIEVIIGETDFEYCISKIHEDDFLLILDAAYFGREPGTVTVSSIEKFYSNTKFRSGYSQHGCSIIKMLGVYGIKVKGFIIGIEGEKFKFDLKLSGSIQDNFKGLCRKINEIICDCIPFDK